MGISEKPYKLYNSHYHQSLCILYAMKPQARNGVTILAVIIELDLEIMQWELETPWHTSVPFGSSLHSPMTNLPSKYN